MSSNVNKGTENLTNATHGIGANQEQSQGVARYVCVTAEQFVTTTRPAMARATQLTGDPEATRRRAAKLKADRTTGQQDNRTNTPGGCLAQQAAVRLRDVPGRRARLATVRELAVVQKPPEEQTDTRWVLASTYLSHARCTYAVQRATGLRTG